MSYAVESTPLNALVYIFAIAASLVALLFVATIVLTWRHAHRRSAHFTPYLERTVNVKDIAQTGTAGVTPDLGEARILTVADLVADRELLDQVWKIARAVDAGAPAQGTAARQAGRRAESEGPTATASPA
jgi:hypothetical protein